jgi:DNA-binding NtrC family response regulator
MISFSILVVDDESNQRETLIEILSDSGFAVEGAEDVESAKVKIENKKFNLVLSDFKMPGGSGLDVAKKALEMDSKTVVMMMTAYADVGSVISAMQAGVADYLLKPLNIDSVIRKVEVLKENFELKTEINRLRAEINSPQKDNRLIGSSPAIQKVRNIISQVALTKGTVLITGESGTGKEVAARMIHSGSSQKDKKFIAINCGAIPENLLESELFGHKKGSFTGAVSDKEGLLSMARGGSVFLDEIGDMPKSLQVKILRAIQEREILPVGGHQPIKIDARLIAATNRDLKADVENGLFRQDLYYRINVVEIVMPPHL